MASRPTMTPHLELNIKKYRSVTDSTVRHLGQWMARYSWTQVLIKDDVETNWINCIIAVTYYRFFPNSCVRLQPADVPWITLRIEANAVANWVFYHNKPLL